MLRLPDHDTMNGICIVAVIIVSTALSSLATGGWPRRRRRNLDMYFDHEDQVINGE